MRQKNNFPQSRWIGTAMMILGALLLLAAGIRIALHQMDQQQAAETSRQLLAELKQEMAAAPTPTPVPTPLPTLPPASPAPATASPSPIPASDPDAPGAWQVEEGELPAAEETAPPDSYESAILVDAETMPQSTQQPDREINGRTYIGSIAIPALEIELPVQSQWDYGKLKETPCYYQGAVLTGDMVLMAHNYDRHFGMLSALPKGAQVHFTDIYQARYTYQLTETVIIDPDQPEKLEEGNWDLTLFTCTEDGLMRVVLRFIRTSA